MVSSFSRVETGEVAANMAGLPADVMIAQCKRKVAGLIVTTR